MQSAEQPVHTSLVSELLQQNPGYGGGASSCHGKQCQQNADQSDNKRSGKQVLEKEALIYTQPMQIVKDSSQHEVILSAAQGGKVNTEGSGVASCSGTGGVALPAQHLESAARAIAKTNQQW